MVGRLRGEQFGAFAVEGNPEKLVEVRIDAFDVRCQQPDFPRLRIDLLDVEGEPATVGDAVLERAAGEVVEVKLPQAVLFGEPNELAAPVQHLPVFIDETGHVMGCRLLAVHIADAAIVNVGQAQLRDLVVAGGRDEGQRFAVGAPLGVEENAASPGDVVAGGRAVRVRGQVEEDDAGL